MYLPDHGIKLGQRLGLKIMSETILQVTHQYGLKTMIKTIPKYGIKIGRRFGQKIIKTNMTNNGLVTGLKYIQERI